jgi:predicted ATP-grasp superfamily ATP-dependent carboligase
LAKRLRILFTEGASLSARQTLYPLGPHHDIDVLDPNPLCQCRFSSYVRKFIRSPSFTKQPVKFLRFVMDLVRGGRYDVLLPTHEQTYLLSRFRDAFTPHVGLALPEFASQERLQNKAEFSRLLDELNLPQPETAIVRTRPEFDREWRYPFYLKLAHSTAGGGVFYIRDKAALSDRIDWLESGGLLRGDTDVLAQQPAKGVLSTVQAVFNRGELIGVHCFESRQLGVGGMSTARTSADHEIVRGHAERIGEHLTWHGAFFIDYFYDNSSSRPEYIEANPRIGETVNAMLAGVNLPQLLVRISVGETPPRAALGRFDVRTHNSLMILMSLACDGAGRTALLRELRRIKAGDEPYSGGEDELTRPREDRLSALPFVYTTSQLLAWPRIAKRIVAKTVGGYSLPEATTQEIKALPLDIVDNASR